MSFLLSPAFMQWSTYIAAMVLAMRQHGVSVSSVLESCPVSTQLLLHATTFECMSTYVTVRSSTPGAGLEGSVSAGAACRRDLSVWIRTGL